MGYTPSIEIQQKAILSVLKGCGLLGLVQTGTGRG